jgi:hypothetical protein
MMNKNWIIIITVGLLALHISNEVGYYIGYREAVLTDYERCADAIHERDVANLDVAKNSPVDNNEWCAAHGDNTYGSRKWRLAGPKGLDTLENPYEKH